MPAKKRSAAEFAPDAVVEPATALRKRGQLLSATPAVPMATPKSSQWRRSALVSSSSAAGAKDAEIAGDEDEQPRGVKRPHKEVDAGAEAAEEEGV